MTEEQIETVRKSDDIVTAAMEFASQGVATLIEFSRDHIVGSCEKGKRNLESADADEVGGWEFVAACIAWESIAAQLLCENPVIIPGFMTDEEVVEFIDQSMQAALDTIAADNDMEDRLTPEEEKRAHSFMR